MSALNMILTNKESILPFSHNITALNREIKGVAFPQSTGEVIELVKLANEKGISLYPVSTGKNWGYGSKLPVKDHCVIVVLSKLNKIHEINVEKAYAVVEPGVTQQQLYDEIKKRGIPLLLNCTGSSSQTSIIGNCLEKGIGYFSSRDSDVLNFEIVNGKGEIFSSDSENAIGPDLKELFFQSNFGIITKAGIRLMRKPQKIVALSSALEDEKKIDQFIDAINYLRKRGILKSNFRIGNKNRSMSTIIPLLTDIIMDEEKTTYEKAKLKAGYIYKKHITSAWTAIGPVYGSNKEVKYYLDEIKKTLAKFGPIRYYTEKELSSFKKLLSFFKFLPPVRDRFYLLQSAEPLVGLSFGKPTDAAIQSLNYNKHTPLDRNMDPDEGTTGLWFLAPVIPFKGTEVKNILSEVENICNKHCFEIFISLNVCSETSLKCIINIFFDKESKSETEKAYICKNELLNYLKLHNYVPYRLGIDDMKKMAQPESPYWRIIKKIKHLFDPNAVIAPERYID